MTDEKLKPCPFCGSNNIIVLTDDDERVWVQCDECCARIWAFMGHEAIAAWNTRTPPEQEQ